jgi:hypothetical protein
MTVDITVALAIVSLKYTVPVDYSARDGARKPVTGFFLLFIIYKIRCKLKYVVCQKWVVVAKM